MDIVTFTPREAAKLLGLTVTGFLLGELLVVEGQTQFSDRIRIIHPTVDCDWRFRSVNCMCIVGTWGKGQLQLLCEKGPSVERVERWDSLGITIYPTHR